MTQHDDRKTTENEVALEEHPGEAGESYPLSLTAGMNPRLFASPPTAPTVRSPFI